MAKYRTSATALAKIFENSALLIYIVGEDWTIQYANQACADWLSLPLEDLFGASLNYRCESSRANPVDVLCPPPDIFSEPSKHRDGVSFPLATPVAFNDDTAAPSTANGRAMANARAMPRYRHARAIPIVDLEHQSVSILVVSDSQDLSQPPDLDADNLDSRLLHAALQEIRRDSRACFRIDSLVGSSLHAQRLRRQVAAAAGCEIDVLIVGPKGSGKEFLARAIHAESPRLNETNLIPVSCSTVDPEWLQSLFANLQKSAQSKQIERQKEGDFEKAANAPPIDSILLRNVDQLSSIAQLELVRLLKGLKTSIRVFATSEVELEQRSNARSFQNELAKRLCGMRIDTVELYQRAEDIPMLVQAVLERKGENHPAGFDKAALQMLAAYRWPGNIDQLISVVEQSLVGGDNRLLTSEDLPRKFIDSYRAQELKPAEETVIDLERYLEEVELELIRRAIAQAKGNKTRAASLLGLSRAKLLRRIQFFKIDTAEPVDNQVAEDSLATNPEIEQDQQIVKDKGTRGSLRNKLLHGEKRLASEAARKAEEATLPEDESDWLPPDAFEEIE